MSFAWSKRLSSKTKRSLIIIHRWVSLTIGILFVAYCTAGAIIVYKPELTHLLKPGLFDATQGNPVSYTVAFDAVHKIDPNFAPTTEYLSRGLYQLTDGTNTYIVNAATGKVNGDTKSIKALGLLENFHMCFMGCDEYAGYIPWFNDPSILANTSFFSGLSWGQFMIEVLGLVAIITIVTGLIIWWPKRKRWKQGFTIDWKKGRFKRDYDLHKVIGIVSLIPLAILTISGMWIITTGFNKVWYSVTDSTPSESQTLTPVKVGPNAKAITMKQAIDAAQIKFPHSKVSAVYFPADKESPYNIYLVHGLNTWDYYSDGFNGNREVSVDQFDAKNTAIINGQPTGWADNFALNWNQPLIHYGITFNAWIRLIWFIFGMAPFALMITGMSTWLFRWNTKRNRKKHKKSKPTETVEIGT